MKIRSLFARLLFRLSAICLAAGLLILSPEPDSDSVLRYKNALVVLFALIMGGKTLYDTLFYDRYR